MEISQMLEKFPKILLKKIVKDTLWKIFENLWKNFQEYLDLFYKYF